MLLLDSSALIDFIIGNERGRKIKHLLEGQHLSVCAVTFAELARWCFQNNVDANSTFSNVLLTCNAIVHTSRTIEKRAGELCAVINKGRSRHEQKVSLIDCIVAATGEYYGITSVATDPDFKEFPQPTIVISP